MQRVIEFDPTTISFSEKTKGWISFKSFTPENGLSLAKQYYTLNNGGLFQHHVNETRNQFYNEEIPEITESSVKMIFNQEPSLIKIFNTLNYEGTQSQIHRYDDNYVDQTIEHYNTTISDNANLKFPSGSDNFEKISKLGWYVKSIVTDKQAGSVKEFVEKEGKWFNYIKGLETEPVLTSQFSFQGIGIISSVTDGSSGGGSGNSSRFTSGGAQNSSGTNGSGTNGSSTNRSGSGTTGGGTTGGGTTGGGGY